MKNVIVCLLFVFGLGFANAQRHPPKPKQPPFISHIKSKKANKKSPFRADRSKKPHFVSPSGKKIGHGPKARKARPHKPNRPHPPKPRFLR